MENDRILIGGIGNIFLGDDAFGSEVARRLIGRELPDSVRVVDFGIRGIDLAYALLDGYDVAILIDATPRGNAPGTLYVIEPSLEELNAIQPGQASIEGHGMNPMKVLETVKAMGGELNRIMIVGCEPATTGEDDQGLMGLSEPVELAVEKAVELVESLVNRIMGERSSTVAV